MAFGLPGLQLKRRPRAGAIIILFIGWLALPYSGLTGPDLSNTNLLVYTGQNGATFPVRSPEDWRQRRLDILEDMQQVMGPLPKEENREAPHFQVKNEVDRGSYLELQITYRSEPGSEVPAYLLVPKTAFERAEKPPAVLCLHPTDNQAGAKVVVGLAEKPNRQYARELTERGYVTLAPAYPLLANYQPDLKELGYQSGTMKAVWDNIRALDLLESLSFVDKTAFGAIGHSLGGHNALFTAAFDERIAAAVSSCGFDSFLDYKDGDISGWTSERYMPKLLEYELAQVPFDFHEVLAAIAPRACFVSAPYYDTNFKWQSVYRIEAAVSSVYHLFGVPENLVVQHPSCGHDFPPEIREKAYDFLDRHLN